MTVQRRVSATVVDDDEPSVYDVVADIDDRSAAGGSDVGVGRYRDVQSRVIALRSRMQSLRYEALLGQRPHGWPSRS